MSEARRREEGEGRGRALHAYRLVLEVSLSADFVEGRVIPEGGTAIPFDGWLSLAQAVVTGARAESGGEIVSGPPLLGGAEPAPAPISRGGAEDDEREAG